MFKWIRKVKKTFPVPSPYIVHDEICIKCGWDTSKTNRVYTDIGTICAKCVEGIGGLTNNMTTEFFYKNKR
jgi:hypothetical protein